MQVSFLIKHLILCLCLQVITSETTNSVGISELQLPITRQGRIRRRRRNRKLLLIESGSSSMSRQKDKSLLEYRLPRRSVTTTSAFGTDRLVPTGPNPLHNSNTTQISYPWYWNHQHLLMYRRPGVSLLILKEKHTLHGHFYCSCQHPTSSLCQQHSFKYGSCDGSATDDQILYGLHHRLCPLVNC